MFTIQTKSLNNNERLWNARQALFRKRVLRSVTIFILGAMSIFPLGWQACAQNSVAIGSDTVLSTTSESTISVGLNVDRDLSLLDLTIQFDPSFLSISEEKIVPVSDRFPKGASNEITVTLDKENGTISLTVFDLLGEAVIASGTGTIFNVEFGILQPISKEGTSIEIASVEISDISLNAVTLTLESGHIQTAEDTDEDGLPDDWENKHFGDLRFGMDDDPDGDGTLNLDELIEGSNPFGIELELNKGWNLVSLGAKKEEGNINTILGDKIVGFAWVWDADIQRYTLAQNVSPENGYWVYSKEDYFEENAIKIELP